MISTINPPGADAGRVDISEVSTQQVLATFWTPTGALNQANVYTGVWSFNLGVYVSADATVIAKVYLNSNVSPFLTSSSQTIVSGSN